MVEVGPVAGGRGRDIVKNPPALQLQRFQMFGDDPFAKITKVAIATFPGFSREPARGQQEGNREGHERDCRAGGLDFCG